MQRIGKMPVNINAMSKREKRAVAMPSNTRLFRGKLAWEEHGCSTLVASVASLAEDHVPARQTPARQWRWSL